MTGNEYVVFVERAVAVLRHSMDMPKSSTICASLPASQPLVGGVFESGGGSRRGSVVV